MLQWMQLNMVHDDITQMISYSLGGVLSKVIFKEGPMNVTLFCMAKGTDISEHSTKKTGVIYVVEGKGIFVIEGNKIEMKKGVVISLPSGAKHSLFAEENTSFLLTLC